MRQPLGKLPAWRDWPEGLFLRLAASGWVPARCYERNLPGPEERAARSGRLSLEIVSHCWRYERLLRYQLSSLVLHPPHRLSVTMTVFHTPDDAGTVAVLNEFMGHNPANITWNWRPLDPGRLFRRAIGRNQAALETKADWIWFTDCDLLFHEGCLDSLADQLQGRRDSLVFPRVEYRTGLLPSSDGMIGSERAGPTLREVDPAQFLPKSLARATGPVQITHGDVARRVGYCNAIRYYQRPVDRFRKAYEDRAFRWLLRTEGTPIELPGVLRIRHLEKGRYGDSRLVSGLRMAIRRTQARFGDRPEPPVTDLAQTSRSTGTTRSESAGFSPRLAAACRGILGSLFGLLGTSGRHGLARAISWIWIDLLRIRRGVVLSNLTLAFPEWTEARRVEVGRKSVTHLCFTAIETLMLSRLNRANYLEHAVIEGLEHLEAARRLGRGTLFLTLHLGNVEKLMAVASLHAVTLNVIAKRFRSRFVDRLVYDLREKFGTRFIDPRGRETARDILRACAREETVAFVLDQFIAPPRGVETTFFGRRTGTAYGLALFALKTQAPVVPVYSHRDSDDRLHVVLEPAFPPRDLPAGTDRTALLRDLTQDYNDRLEAIVRRHPEQWMWVHRRWKPFPAPDEGSKAGSATPTTGRKAATPGAR